MQRRRLVLPILVVVLAFGTSACAELGFPGNLSNDVGVSPPDPGTGQGSGGGGVVGGGSGGGGIPGPAGVDPGTGMKPSIETPMPGRLQPRPVNVWAMTPTVDGGHVTVLLEWWSGPAPCLVLDSVRIVRDGTSFSVTPMEGADPASGGQVACPAIAMLRGTVVDLGILAPGTYILATHGDLAPQELTVR